MKVALRLLIGLLVGASILAGCQSPASSSSTKLDAVNAGSDSMDPVISTVNEWSDYKSIGAAYVSPAYTQMPKSMNSGTNG